MFTAKYSIRSGLVGLTTAASLLALGCTNPLKTDSSGSSSALHEKQDAVTSVIPTEKKTFFDYCTDPEVDSDIGSSLWEIASQVVESNEVLDKMLDHDETACRVAQEELNDRTRLELRYPGTFSGPSSLLPLVGLTQLTELYCDCMMVEDFTPLALLPNLTELSLDTYSLKTGSDFVGLVGLRKLDLFWVPSTAIIDFADFKTLRSLEDLRIHGGTFKNLEALDTLQSLKSYHLVDSAGTEYSK